MIECARRHAVDERRALRIDMVDPAARDRAAEESREQPVDRPRRARRGFFIAEFRRRDLGLDRLGVRP